MAELDALAKALEQPARPLLAIVAGSKVSTKLELLGDLVGKVDQLIVGGGIANTFIAAMGHGVGKSLCEHGPARHRARRSWPTPRRAARDIPMPERRGGRADVSPPMRPPRSSAVDDVGADDMILDIGPETAARYAELIAAAGTVMWNGPVGVFEFDAFGKGTEALAQAIAAFEGVLDRRRRRHAGGGGQVRRRATASPTSPPAAAPSSSSARARCCRRWRR